MDAVGIFAYDNDSPLVYQDTTNPALLYEIVSRTNNEMRLRCLAPNDAHGNNYLGAILSADRSVVYWENNTRPVPVS